jgi:stage III sporulation protein AE
MVSLLASFVIVPLMSCYLGIGLVGSVMPVGAVGRIGEGIKKTALWILTLTLTLFLGLLSVQTTVNRAADNMGVKTLKFLIGTFVPVAGGALSESLTTLLGSVKLLKSSVSMFGVIGISATAVPVVLELFAWRAVLFVLSLAAELFGVELKTSMLRAADTVISVLVGVLLFVAVLFIISLAVISGG